MTAPLTLMWHVPPPVLQLMWLGALQETLLAYSNDETPQFAAIIGPPGPQGEPANPADIIQLRTFINNNVSSLSALTTTTKTDLVAAINELKLATETSGLDDFNLEIVDPQQDDLLQFKQTKWKNIPPVNLTDGGNF